MKVPLASDGDPALLFAWDQPHRRNRALGGFLAGSIILHALCFYLFQIIYPPAVALLPPPGRVTVIAPNTDEGRRLLTWLEAEDPALASVTQLPANGKALALPVVQHAPSYLMRLPPLKELPPAAPDPAIPSARPPAPIEPLTPRAPLVTKAAPTIIRLSHELEILGALQGPETKFFTSMHDSPRTAEFRVAVDLRGAVRYCFLEKSSGDIALDEQARKYLALSRFPPIGNRKSEVENDQVWGMVTIEWGNDIVPSQTKVESVAP